MARFTCTGHCRRAHSACHLPSDICKEYGNIASCIHTYILHGRESTNWISCDRRSRWWSTGPAPLWRWSHAHGQEHFCSVAGLGEAVCLEGPAQLTSLAMDVHTRPRGWPRARGHVYDIIWVFGHCAVSTSDGYAWARMFVTSTELV